jgi:transposase-like protein
MYLRVQGQWCYLYRAVDSKGATVEFFLFSISESKLRKACFAEHCVTERITSRAA